MNKFVWLNPYLPQTLQISVQLAYFRVAFAILFSGIMGLLDPISILVLGGTVLGAFGIANVRWWGYILSIIFAFLPFAIGIFFTIAYGESIVSYFTSLFSGRLIISTIFDIAIVALLLHPESRSYVKSNFEKTIP